MTKLIITLVILAFASVGYSQPRGVNNYKKPIPRPGAQDVFIYGPRGEVYTYELRDFGSFQQLTPNQGFFFPNRERELREQEEFDRLFHQSDEDW